MKLNFLTMLLPALFSGAFLSHMAERGSAGSAIEKELVDATELGNKRGEDRPEFLLRLMKAVQELNDKEWDALSEAAQEWFNTCADAVNANKKDPDSKFALPDFPDLKQPPKEEEAPARRRGAGKEDPSVIKAGDKVEIETKRGKKLTGEVVEIDDKIVVIKTADGEEEFSRDRLESITALHGTAKPAADEEPADALRIGVEVKLVTKRGKEVTGKIVEMDAEVMVLDVDGKDEEFSRDRVESITPVGGARAGRQARGGDTKGDDKAPEGGKTPRSSNAPGVSIGMRIKELIAENLDASVEDIGKLLKNEGIEFKENTLALNYTECHKLVDCLVKLKKLKK